MRCGCLNYNGFLTDRGYAEVAQRELELHGVDAMGSSRYLDIPGSVSALLELELPDDLLEEQYRRFHNGS